MAERLKKQLLEEEKLVDIVAGPDAYRELPVLLTEVLDGKRAMNVILSLEETYAEIQPTRLDSNGVTAFISIMRGCDNMCTFCVVPFTRGRERSRDPHTVVQGSGVTCLRKDTRRLLYWDRMWIPTSGMGEDPKRTFPNSARRNRK